MIPQEKIVEIRDRASVVELISDYVTLKKVGRNYIGLCPFHSEKTPSFTVNDEKGIFHCFSCKVGGSIFNFLMLFDHLSFPEAVEQVGKRYGISVERAGSARKSGEEDEREALYRLNERAAVNYHRVLFNETSGKKALEYIKNRGIDESMARRFILGFAPQYGSGFLDIVKSEKLSLKNALRLGLIGQRDGNRFYEKFFARLMFPIANAGGKVIGFGGRVVDQGLPKYLNSSDTPLFHKGSTLYGLFQAKEGIRKNDRVVLVEGYLDVIALHQYGVDYAVATLGTSLTVEHVRALARYSKNVIALFDGDEAGSKAAARSFEIFVDAGLLGQAAFLPKGEDPDTFVRGHGKRAVEELLARSVPLADYYFSGLEQRYGKSLEGKGRIAGEISRLLQKVRNVFEVDILVARAVDSLGIREEFLRQPLRDSAPRKSAVMSVRGVPPNNPANRDDAADRTLISLVLCFPEIARHIFKESEALQWVGSSWREVVDLIGAEWQEHGNIDVFRIAQKVDADKAAQIAGLAIEGESIAEAESEKMAIDCIAYLRRKYLREQERSLRIAIRTAEEQKDENAKRERMLEWQDIKERQLERRKLAPKTAR
ncbi:MAG: DNA primase [Deltaproteobacteria bacterium]|nr:DNA primase [Deltaproteobacteria bacterium]